MRAAIGQRKLPPLVNKNSEMLREVHTILIDEMSMITRSSLNFTSTAFQAAKNIGSPDQFPAVNVVLLGDVCQLPPVGGASLCSNNGAENGKPTSWTRGFFKSITHVIVLTKQFRSEDADVRDFQNALRYGTFTQRHADFMAQHLLSQQMPTTQKLPIFIVATNAQRASHIDCVLNHVLHTKPECCVTWTSENDGEELTLKAFNKLCTKQKEGPNAGIQAAPKFAAHIGMRVVITKNLSPALGIANGAMGIIKALHFRRGTTFETTSTRLTIASRPPDYIDVQLYAEPKVALPGYESNVRPVPLISQDQSITFPHNGTVQTVKVKYEAIPIIQGDAITAHSAQGRTFKDEPVCISDVFAGRVQNRAMLFYVACTRITRGQNLYFETAVNLNTLITKCKMPSWVHEEWERLNTCSRNTIQRFFSSET